MNNKIKALIYIAGFAILILTAVFGYNYLTERYRAPNTPGLPTSANSTTPVADNQSSAPSTSGYEQETKDPQERENPHEEQRSQGEERVKAFDFTAQDYDGNEVKLSDYIGTPIVLNFWASWCPPCREEMPHFNKVSEEYSEDELIFLMVDLVDGTGETIESGKEHVEEAGYTFTVLFDTKQDAAITYGIQSIPVTIFIDKDGYIEGAARGTIDEETLRYGISLILDE